MNQDQMSSENVNIVCQITLTENQVKQALMNTAGEDKKLVSLLDGKDCHLWVKWHVCKWDNPDEFCTLTFGVEKKSSQDVSSTPHED